MGRITLFLGILSVWYIVQPPHNTAWYVYCVQYEYECSVINDYAVFIGNSSIGILFMCTVSGSHGHTGPSSQTISSDHSIQF